MENKILKVMEEVVKNIPEANIGNKTAILNIEFNLGKYHAYMDLLDMETQVKMYDLYNSIAISGLEAVENIYK